MGGFCFGQVVGMIDGWVPLRGRLLVIEYLYRPAKRLLDSFDIQCLFNTCFYNEKIDRVSDSVCRLLIEKCSVISTLTSLWNTTGTSRLRARYLYPNFYIYTS